MCFQTFSYCLLVYLLSFSKSEHSDSTSSLLLPHTIIGSSEICSLGLIPWASNMQRMIPMHMPRLRPLDGPLKLSHGTTVGQPCGGLPFPYFCFFGGPKPD